MCAAPNGPVLGLFGTWNNVPVRIAEAARPETIVQYAVHAVSVTPSYAYTFAMGYYVERQDARHFGATAFWHEYTSAGGGRFEWNPIAAPGSSLMDGKMHSYMAVRNGDANAFDILYDFQPVGQTHLQSTRAIVKVDAGVMISDSSHTAPNLVDISAPNADERIQYLDRQRIWQKLIAADVNIGATTPNCGLPGAPRPPGCLYYNLIGSNPINAFTVGKPGAPAAGMVGGNSADTGTMSQPTARQIAARAADRLGLRQSDVSVQLASTRDSRVRGAMRSAHASTDTVWVATSDKTVRATDRIGHRLRGATVEYDTRTGRVLHMCLGTGCEFR